MTDDFAKIWIYLAAQPLFGLTVTLLAYLAGVKLAQLASMHPLANPVAIAVALTIAALWVLDIDYRRYFEGAQFIHFLLGPATVALAVPLAQSWPRMNRHGGRLILAIVGGGVVSAGSAVLLSWLLGASDVITQAMAAKSVTAPIAMGVAERLGALAPLTAAFCILSGMIGAATGRLVFDRMGIKPMWARGLALGTAAHGIGTARAFAVSPVAGSYAAFAMGSHGILAALFLPGFFALILAVMG